MSIDVLVKEAVKDLLDHQVRLNRSLASPPAMAGTTNVTWVRAVHATANSFNTHVAPALDRAVAAAKAAGRKLVFAREQAPLQPAKLLRIRDQRVVHARVLDGTYHRALASLAVRVNADMEQVCAGKEEVGVSSNAFAKALFSWLAANRPGCVVEQTSYNSALLMGKEHLLVGALEWSMRQHKPELLRPLLTAVVGIRSPPESNGLSAFAG